MPASEMMRAADAAALFTREGMLDEAASSDDPRRAEACRAVATEILTPGMPLAALPVESLYKPWSAMSTELAAAKGLYMGDPAHHLLHVYAECGIEVPPAFSATPDHLALIVELAALLAEAGNAEGAAQVVADHLDWLATYDAELAERAAKAFGIAPLEEGIAMLRKQLAELMDLVGSFTR